LENVNAIIFVTSAAAYDQQLAEDPTVNRMVDSVQLFRTICNHKLLQSCNMILFLNKMDILERKARTSSLDGFYEAFTVENELNIEKPEKPTQKDISRFFKRLFMIQNKNPKKNIYCHYTTSTDTKQMEFIMMAIT
jgi:hypothetical protein